MYKIDMSHGSPYDRGGADSYYRRKLDPHYWPQGTYHGTRIEKNSMTDLEIEEYYKGYDDNEFDGNFKEY